MHGLEEDEFFDLESFRSRTEFLAKVTTYQLYFNLVRPNTHKENQSPWQIIERLAPRSPLELCLLPQCSWITASNDERETIYLVFPGRNRQLCPGGQGFPATLGRE